MRRAMRWLGLLALVLFVVPAVGSDDPKKDTKKPTTGEEKKKADKKAATGDEKDADAKKADDKKSAAKAKGAFRDRVVVLQTVDGRLGKVDDVQKLELHLAYVKDKNIEYVDKPVELPRAEDLVVRLNFLPPVFDDKGRPRRYTKKELEDLRGPDKSLPMYAGDVDSLKPGQIVRVYIGRKKNAPKSEPAIVMVVIMKEAPS